MPESGCVGLTGLGGAGTHLALEVPTGCHRGLPRLERRFPQQPRPRRSGCNNDLRRWSLCLRWRPRWGRSREVRRRPRSRSSCRRSRALSTSCNTSSARRMAGYWRDASQLNALSSTGNSSLTLPRKPWSGRTRDAGQVLARVAFLDGGEDFPSAAGRGRCSGWGAIWCALRRHATLVTKRRGGPDEVAS